MIINPPNHYINSKFMIMCFWKNNITDLRLSVFEKTNISDSWLGVFEKSNILDLWLGVFEKISSLYSEKNLSTEEMYSEN